MSGFGNFHAIGGGNAPRPIQVPPQPANDIIPVNGEAGGHGGDVEIIPVDDPRQAQAHIFANLDRMLLKAAGDASALGKVLTTMRSGIAKLDQAQRTKLDGIADQVQAAMTKVSAYSGKQVADAIVKDDITGVFDWDMNNPVGEAIHDALEKLAQLSEELGETLNFHLPPDASDELRDALEDAILMTDRRAAEFQEIICEFADMKEKDGDDPEVAKRLAKTVESLIPEKSLKMYDTAKVAEDFKNTLMPLAEEIDALAAQAEHQIKQEDLMNIRRRLGETSNALTHLETTHIQENRPLDSTLFASARSVIASLNAKLGNFYEDAKRSSMVNFVEKTFSAPDIPILGEQFSEVFKSAMRDVADAVEAQAQLKAAAMAYIDNPDEEHRKTMEEIADRLAKCGPSAKRALRNAKNDAQLKAQFAEAAAKMDFDAQIDALLLAIGGAGGVKTQTARLVAMQELSAKKSSLDFLTNKTLRAAFEGEIAFTTLVETRMRGLPDVDADPALDSSNAVSEKAIGSGLVNTVYEVAFKDKTTKAETSYIFKPEAPGRQGLETVAIGWESYEANQMVAQLNMAAQRTAETLGVEDVMTKTSVGAFKGQFGMFMEKAPGKEAAKFNSKDQPVEPDSLNAEEIRNLANEDYEKVVGQLMRKSNRLEWFDLIAGQGDRHNHNYMVGVNKKCEVTLKGIDNDACFVPSWRGPGIFRIRGQQAKLFRSKLSQIKGLFCADRKEREENRTRFDKDPGLTVRLDDGYDIDVSKIKSPELLHCVKMSLGIQSPRIPDYIDEELYDKLVALESGPAREAYIDSMKERLSERQIWALKDRLDEAINLAKRLKQEKKVISADDWLKHDVQRKVAGKSPDELNVSPDDFPEKDRQNVVKVKRDARMTRVCMFRRDFIPALAKPGWFDD